jgi:hypothetical protein
MQVTCASFELWEPFAPTEILRRLSTAHVVLAVNLDGAILTVVGVVSEMRRRGAGQITVLVLLSDAGSRAIVLEYPPPVPRIQGSALALNEQLSLSTRAQTGRISAHLLCTLVNIAIEHKRGSHDAK